MNQVFLTVLMAVACSTMAGCAATHEQRLEQAESINEASDKCKAAAYSRLDIRKLQPVIQFGNEHQQAFAYKAIDRKPTDDEKQAIKAYAAAMDACNSDWLKMLSGMAAGGSGDPIIVGSAHHFRNIDSLLAELYKGNLTYGDYAVAVEKSEADYTGNMQGIIEKQNTAKIQAAQTQALQGINGIVTTNSIARNLDYWKMQAK